MQLLKSAFKLKSSENPKKTHTHEEIIFRFRVLTPELSAALNIGKTKYMSGISLSFITVTPPPRKSYALVAISSKKLMDYLTTDFLLVNNQAVIKIIHTHLNLNNGLFEVEAEFVSSDEKNTSRLFSLIKEWNLQEKL